MEQELSEAVEKLTAERTKRQQEHRQLHEQLQQLEEDNDQLQRKSDGERRRNAQVEDEVRELSARLERQAQHFTDLKSVFDEVSHLSLKPSPGSHSSSV